MALTAESALAKLLAGSTDFTPKLSRSIDNARWHLSAPEELTRLMQTSSGSADLIDLPYRLRLEGITRPGEFRPPELGAVRAPRFSRSMQ